MQAAAMFYPWGSVGDMLGHFLHLRHLSAGNASGKGPRMAANLIIIALLTFKVIISQLRGILSGPQEILEKVPQMPEDTQWHFIGHLQSNKAKSLVGECSIPLTV